MRPESASVMQIVAGLFELNGMSRSQAKNAYSAVLLIPGLDQIRFHPLLARYKREWNCSVERYGAFWDAQPMLFRLARVAVAEAQQE